MKFFLVIIAVLLAGGLAYTATKQHWFPSVNKNVPASLDPVKLEGQARDNRRLDDIHAIENALAQYFGENGAYPTSLDQLAPTFIGIVPTDPWSHQPYEYVQQTAPDASYTVTYTLEVGAQSLSAGQHIARPNTVANP